MIKDIRRDFADIIEKFEVDKRSGMPSQVIAYYLARSLAALELAMKDAQAFDGSDDEHH